MVIMNTWALHHDRTYWNEPEKFHPERFIDKEGNFEAKHYNFMPFGTGRRVCVGESLAKVELFLLTATMFHNYSVQPAPEETFTDDNMMPVGMLCIAKKFNIIAKQRHT